MDSPEKYRFAHITEELNEMEEQIIDAELGKIQCRHKRVALIGAGPGRKLAPYGDSTWCVWALNEIWQPAFTRHFELHPMEVQSISDLEWLERCPTPCYVLDLEEARKTHVRNKPAHQEPLSTEDLIAVLGPVANPVLFPIDRIAAMGFGDYFTCTFAYQVALAIYEGMEEIGLWGISLHEGSSRERLVEKACVEYWLGIAEGRGITITGREGLCSQPFRYGYDYKREVTYVNSVVDKMVKVHNAERAIKEIREAEQRID